MQQEATPNQSQADMDTDKTSISYMLKTFWKLATPILVAELCDSLQQYTITIFFALQLNDAHKVAGVALALTMLTFVTCISNGSQKPMELYTAQAFGAGQIALCGIYLNRARFIMTAFFIPPTCILVLFSRQILINLG